MHECQAHLAERREAPWILSKSKQKEPSIHTVYAFIILAIVILTIWLILQGCTPKRETLEESSPLVEEKNDETTVPHEPLKRLHNAIEAPEGCTRSDGKKKRAFATRAAAEKELTTGYKVYRCKEHGYHIGHELTRALRRNLTSAARKASAKRSAKKKSTRKKARRRAA